MIAEAGMCCFVMKRGQAPADDFKGFSTRRFFTFLDVIHK